MLTGEHNLRENYKEVSEMAQMIQGRTSSNDIGQARGRGVSIDIDQLPINVRFARSLAVHPGFDEQEKDGEQYFADVEGVVSSMFLRMDDARQLYQALGEVLALAPAHGAGRR
jgi:hypothetical protein